MALVIKSLPACEREIRDAGSIPGWGRSPGEGNGNPLQYSSLENPQGQSSLMGYSPRGCRESDTELVTHTHTDTQTYIIYMASQVMLVVKNLPANARDLRDTRSIPGSGRSPRGGRDNPPQYSCLENPTDRGAWQATVHRVAESDRTEVIWHAHTCVCTCTCAWMLGKRK